MYIDKFTEIVHHEGKNVVSLLDMLFREYDFLCEEFGVLKIETVG